MDPNQDSFTTPSGQDYEDEQLRDEFDRIQEDEIDQTAYKKELWAKMYGGKLTNRQFEVLTNIV